MGKLIAVCGSPNSGKTITALKLAQEIYSLCSSPVYFLSPDLNVPTMAYLFPNRKNSDLYSVGTALDKTDIYKEDVLKQTVSVKEMQNFGYLGFKLGENRYSYPRPTEDKITQLLTVLKDSADYVIVDCTCDNDDMVSSIAKRDCDVAVLMLSPDIKCIAYYASCVNQFLMIEDKKIKVLNVMDNDIYLPIEDAKKHFHDVDYTLPYERMLKQQMITGTASDRIGNGKYRVELDKLAKEVM